MPRPARSHDLNLPAWGPYSKRYSGISHIPDASQGLRFDLAVVPGFYRRQMLVPNEKWASGHHAWEAAPELSYCAYRYELEWKDQVYCDVSFSAVSAQARLLRCAFVNNTDLAQNLMLHLVAFMNFPPVSTDTDEPIRMAKVDLPDGGLWIDALDYEELQFATARPTDNLTLDGMLRAEVREHGLVQGSGIGFGQEAGDWVQFRFDLHRPLKQAALTIRYRLAGAQPARFRLEGTTAADVTFDGKGADGAGFAEMVVAAGGLDAGESVLRFVSLGGGDIELDGFAVTAASQTHEVRFSIHSWTQVPKILDGPQPNSLILKYADTETVYGLAWDHPDWWLRQYYHDELDCMLRHLVPNNYSPVVHGSGEGHFTDAFLRPVPLPPRSERTVYGLVCAGSRRDVEGRLAEFAQETPGAFEEVYRSARKQAVALSSLPSGETYRFSQERMAATELMNVVYPVYTRRQYIRHYTPGKWWDSLYTWDSGFIGLGLLELDVQRAVDCLNAYVTDPGDDHAAFVLHGSPVPTQFYLFHELWNRTQDRALLERFYPSLRQYYLFMAGRLGSSTTRELESNILKTWDYCSYNSAGWDDYPAQHHAIAEGPTGRTTDVAITAHVIRCAKTLLAASETLGVTKDRAVYNADITVFAEALQRHSWDGEAGYFSYVNHDQDGHPVEHLRHESGANYNMGLDGMMPLVAGICTTEQEELMLERLADPERLWTRIGLSTVDQSAPYYRKEGYWNGAVWMPYQWLFWKTALDLGQGEFAYRIAKTALDLWKAEVEATYYCFEHFLIESGRGTGWHQFGGLSSPVLSWFSAYHRPGRLTAGLDTWVEEQQFSNQGQSFKGRLRSSRPGRPAAVVVNLQPGTKYSASWNGKPVEYREINPGSLQIEFPSAQIGYLEVIADADPS
jgi:hypothetical protein